MKNEANKLAAVNDAPLAENIVASLVIDGDLSKLSKRQQLEYYLYRCKELGLDPAEQPFALLKLNGKMVLYAKKACTDAMCRERGVTREILSSEVVNGACVVRVRATCGGRSDEDIGTVSIKGLGGDAYANALMKATTKAKRRAVLALFGVGALDESELETIPGAHVEVMPTTERGYLDPGPDKMPVAVVEIDDAVKRPHPGEDASPKQLLWWKIGEIARLRRLQGISCKSTAAELRDLRGGKAWPSGKDGASEDDYDNAIAAAEIAIHELKEDLDQVEEGMKLMPGLGEGEEPR